MKTPKEFLPHYIAVRSTTLEVLQEQVNIKLGHGYRPHGGLVTHRDEQHDLVYIQLMLL